MLSLIYQMEEVVMMTDIIHTLQNIVNTTSSSDDIDINIARSLLQNIHAIDGNATISMIAEVCSTSQSSISRFISKLGFLGFADFKEALVHLNTEQIELKISNCSEVYDLESLCETVSSSMDDLVENFDIHVVNNLVDAVYHAKRIVIFTTRIMGNLSLILQHALLTTGKLVILYPQIHDQIHAAHNLCEGDLAIFISMEGTLLMNKAVTIPVISSNVKTVLITQSKKQKFSEHFDHIISLGNHDVSRVAKYKLLLFIDMFINRYYSKYL